MLKTKEINPFGGSLDDDWWGRIKLLKIGTAHLEKSHDRDMKAIELLSVL